MEADVRSVRIDPIRLLRHLMIWESTLRLDLVEEVEMRGQGYVLIVPLSMKGRGRIVISVDFPLVGRSAEELNMVSYQWSTQEGSGRRGLVHEKQSVKHDFIYPTCIQSIYNQPFELHRLRPNVPHGRWWNQSAAYWAIALPSTAANCSLNPRPINILLISWVPAPTVYSRESRSNLPAE